MSKEQESGTRTADVCRTHEMSEATITNAKGRSAA
ncbi:hypothetical protein [Agrobacterium pusense]